MCWGPDVYNVVSGATEMENVRFIDISAGRHHVCGIQTDRTVNCWGGVDNPPEPVADYGQAVVPERYQSSTFSKIAAAEYHTCGILDGQNGQVEGEIVCWGDESDYDPLHSNIVSGPRAVPPDAPFPRTLRTPHTGAGVYVNCALTADKSLVCWGGSVNAPTFVEGPFTHLSMGSGHMCVLREGDGHVVCFGGDAYLQSSGGKGISPAGRSLVQDLYTDFSFKFVAAGNTHSCGILKGANPIPVEGSKLVDGSIVEPMARKPSAIFSDYSDTDELTGLADGQVLCWGDSTQLQTLPPSNTFSSISAGFYHSCGLLDTQNSQSDGTAVCWGADGDPTANFGQAEVPVEITDLAFRSISAGTYHTCAVRSDNEKIECWGRDELAEVPSELRDEQFRSVNVSTYFSCGITTSNRVRCWGPSMLNDPDSNDPVRPYNLNQFHVPSEFTDAEFVDVSASRWHACATNADGLVLCWGADADPSTPKIDIYSGSAIINTRQAWVPQSFRASLPPPTPPTPLPTSDVRILRIEPAVTAVQLKSGGPVRLHVEVFGRQDLRDDSLGDRPDVSFEWTIERVPASGSSDVGEFNEAVSRNDVRVQNGIPDDRRVLYNAPSQPGRFIVRAFLEPGTECLGRRNDETEDDVLERCSAAFDVTVKRTSSPSPTTVPPRNPSGEIPAIITDSDGINYEVFTPEHGGEFITEKCSFKVPVGAVNDSEVIGVFVKEITEHEDRLTIDDPRYRADGIQCRISAVTVHGVPVNGYLLIKPGEVCMPLPQSFRPQAIDALVGAINADATLTGLGGGLFLTNSGGGLKVCGNVSQLSATTTVALRAETVAKLTPTAPPQPPDAEEPDTGASRPTPMILVIALIGGGLITAAAIGIPVFRRRRMTRE